MIDIDLTALRKMFERGTGRTRMTTTLTPHADELLREMVPVGKGGAGGPLISLALELLAYVFDVTGYTGEEALAEQLCSLNPDFAYRLATRLDLLADWIRVVDRQGPKEEKAENKGRFK